MRLALVVVVAALAAGAFVPRAEAAFQLASYYYSKTCEGQPYTASLVTVGACFSLRCIGWVDNGREVGFRVSCPNSELEGLPTGKYAAVINAFRNRDCTGDITNANFFLDGQCIDGYDGGGSTQYNCDNFAASVRRCSDSACQNCTEISLTGTCNQGAAYTCLNPASSVAPALGVVLAALLLAALALAL